MKNQKLFIIAAIVCLLAVFSFGFAYAQDEESAELNEIIAEFCDDIQKAANEAGDELDEASRDQDDCRDEFRECRTGSGFGEAESLVECLNEGNTCVSRVKRDQAEACEEFTEDFEDAYEDAFRDADQADVDDGLEEFFSTPTPERNGCLATSIQVIRVCAGLAE
jgi:vacuolar-type H+-ATPase subunit I/STV1